MTQVTQTILVSLSAFRFKFSIVKVFLINKCQLILFCLTFKICSFYIFQKIYLLATLDFINTYLPFFVLGIN